LEIILRDFLVDILRGLLLLCFSTPQLGHRFAPGRLPQPQLAKNHLLLDGFLFDRLDDDAPVDSAVDLQSGSREKTS
jgi:hypothetical protein